MGTSLWVFCENSGVGLTDILGQARARAQIPTSDADIAQVDDAAKTSTYVLSLNCVVHTDVVVLDHVLRAPG